MTSAPAVVFILAAALSLVLSSCAQSGRPYLPLAPPRTSPACADADGGACVKGGAAPFPASSAPAPPDRPAHLVTEDPVRSGLGLSSQPLAPGSYAQQDGTRIEVLPPPGRPVRPLQPSATTTPRGYIVEFDTPPLLAHQAGAAKGRSIADAETYHAELESLHAQFKGQATTALNEDLSGAIRHEFHAAFNGMSLDVSAEEAKALELLPHVKRVVPNRRVEAVLMDAVPGMNTDLVWGMGYDGSGITVGVIDTGIDYTHPDLGGCLGSGCKVAGGFDFINQDADPMDDQGHGTHVAGIIASTDGSGAGAKGMAPGATLLAYKVLNEYGFGSIDGVLAGIERAVQDGADIISLSLGGVGDPDDPLSEAIDAAVESGVVAVIAAGNGGPWPETISSPGTARRAITVGAAYKTDYTGVYWGDSDPRQRQITSFSSRGPVLGDTFGLTKPDVLAPGAIICSARYDTVFPPGEHTYFYPCIDEAHVQLAGTSMATPVVAGLAALLLDKNPDWGPDEIKAAIRNTAYAPRFNAHGFGHIDPPAAVQSPRPPVARLNTSGKISGAHAAIAGTASSDNFGGFTVAYTSQAAFEAGAPAWTAICSGTQPVADAALCDWSLAGVPEGWSVLRLQTAGNTLTGTDYAYVNVRNNEITSPADLRIFLAPREIHSGQTPLEILGSAFLEGFDGYNITWQSHPAGDPRTDGITLANGGQQPVSGGTLADFDPAILDLPGFYSFNMTVAGASRDAKVSTLAYLDPALHAGWPQPLLDIGGGWSAYSLLDQPTLADVDLDGTSDIIFAYLDRFAVLDYRGAPLPGWPRRINTTCGYPGAMQRGPAVADLDGDGLPELAVGDNCGYVHLFNHDGTEMREPIEIGSYVITPVVADINGDGAPELIVGNWWRELHVIDPRTGSPLPGWPQRIDPPQNSSYLPLVLAPPAVADLDGDGLAELVVHSMGCTRPTGCGANEYNSHLWVLGHDGLPRSGWPQYLSGPLVLGNSNVILSDLDGDGATEIIVGTYGGFILVFAADGAARTGWPQLTGASDLAIAVGDVDSSHALEIAALGYSSAERQDCFYLFDANGTQLTPPRCDSLYPLGVSMSGRPMIDNLDEHYDAEFTMGAIWGSIYASEFYLARYFAFKSNRGVVPGFPKFLDSPAFGDTAPVGDVDGDGLNELIITTWDGSVFVYDLPGRPLRGGWPVFQHDAQHTGRTSIPPRPYFQNADVNADDILDIEDLAGVAVDFRRPLAVRIHAPTADRRGSDTNADDAVDVLDLVFVASALDGRGSVSVPIFPVPPTPVSD